MAIRNHKGIHCLWDVACKATYREIVFPNTNAYWMSPRDGILYTTERHKLKGVMAHTNWENDHCGTLQGLAVIHSPLENFPERVLRLGVAFNFDCSNQVLQQRMQQLMLERWSSSPEIYVRTAPLPRLGSPTQSNLSWKTIGGDAMPKEQVLKLTKNSGTQHAKVNLP